MTDLDLGLQTVLSESIQRTGASRNHTWYQGRSQSKSPEGRVYCRGIGPLSIPVHRPGGQSRPFFTTRFWEPSESEAEEGDQGEVIVLEHIGAIDLIALGEEYLGPRSRLCTPPTSKASSVAKSISPLVKASSAAASSSSSPRPVPTGVSSGSSSAAAKARPRVEIVETSVQATILDPLRYFYPPPGASVADVSQEPKRPGRVAGSLGSRFPSSAVA